jgi:hypothetical protein
MTTTLKAVPTRYKGYLLRSRLEARWAVFFDHVRLADGWVYESDGIYLGEYGWYLPDFWLPYPFSDGWGTWVEIKPRPLTDREICRLAALAKITGHRSYAFCGQPWPGEHRVAVFQHHHGGTPKRIPLCANGSIRERVGIHPCCQELYIGTPAGKRFPFPGTRWPSEPVLEAAFRAARSARFEHGEGGL